VRFLIDAQLPPALVRYLIARGHEAEHVALGLERESDRRIWDRAAAAGAVLITKDEDFVTMRALSRSGGPAIVWVRTGNTTTRFLIKTLDGVIERMIDALARGETVVQIPDD
jgi:predicted nuclease of predicted toxin-antitoxin system